ncbi:hypothetical protein E4T56_gene17929, partial [Termitomyces sp. T112]
HIPGAWSIPAAANLAPDGRFAGVDQLRDLYAPTGALDGGEVGVYCGAGVSAAHDVLALALLGVDAAMYPGTRMSRILSGPFDAVISRRGTGSNKWSRYDEDVLPLWVADMDFAVPECVAQAVAERAAHKVYGYAAPPPELRSVLVEDLAARFDWHVFEEAIVFLPGVEPGISMALAAFLKAGDGVAQHTPAHRPLLRAPGF